jgi:pimeloyl-ACP methyl ester carboxylesterase
MTSVKKERTQYSNEPQPQSAVRHVVYLHGFASSPESSKARRFARELEGLGVGFSCPDFNLPSFETLTITRMLEQTREAIAAAAGGPVALVGSSLGAFVALHAAARDTTGRVDRLVLLAPALDFGGNRLRQLGEHGIEEWRRAGKLPFFHYALNRPAEVGFALYEDAGRYDAHAVDVLWPTLVFQGSRDASVDPAMVSRWAATRQNVDLHMVDDEHQLSASIDDIWQASARLMGLLVYPA